MARAVIRGLLKGLVSTALALAAGHAAHDVLGFAWPVAVIIGAASYALTLLLADELVRWP